MKRLQLTELVMAARCPRHLTLHRLGLAVQPEEEPFISKMTHDALLHSLLPSAHQNQPLIQALDAPEPNENKVALALWKLFYDYVYEPTLTSVGTLDGDAVVVLDPLLRSLSSWLAKVLILARAIHGSAREALAHCLVSTDENVEVLVGNIVVEGSVALRCIDESTGRWWLWDLQNHANCLPTQEQILHFHALSSAPSPEPLLLFRCNDTFLQKQLGISEEEKQRWEKSVAVASNWTEEARGQVIPPTEDRSQCRVCAVQQACWERWGRTLSDIDQAVQRSALAKISRPMTRASVTEEVETRSVPTEWNPPALWLGEERGSGRAACLHPTDLKRHIAVLGAQGSGKTCLAKTILEEAALLEIPCLVLDSRGDLAQLIELGDAGSEILAIRREALDQRREVRLFSPGSNAGLQLSLHPLWFPEGVDESTRRICSVVMAESLLGAMHMPETWAELAREYLAQVLDTPLGAASLVQLMARVREPIDLRTEPLLRSRTRRQALAEQLRCLAEGAQKHLFEVGSRLDLDSVLAPAEPGKTPVNVVWLPGVGDEQERYRFAATVLSDVCAWMSKKTSSSLRLLLCLDEVGPFMPPLAEPPMKKLLLRILHQGPEHGVSCLFCSRGSMDVDFKVLAHLGTVFLGRVGSPQEKARVRKVLPFMKGFDPTAAADMLSNAVPGRFLLSNIDRFGTPLTMQARLPLSLHTRPWGEEQVRAHTLPEARQKW